MIVYDMCMLLLDDIRKMFSKVMYSAEGSNDRMKEEATYMFFVDYLDDCEGSKWFILS